MIIVRHSVVYGFALQGFSCWTQRYSAFEAKLEFLPEALTANALLRSVPAAFFSDFRCVWGIRFLQLNPARARRRSRGLVRASACRWRSLR